jgi:hypothetical protein
MSKNLQAGVDYYFDESGYMVLTEKYHLNRGHCCGNGCRHCPFDYINVPEPARKRILSLRENGNKSKVDQDDE